MRNSININARTYKNIKRFIRIRWGGCLFQCFNICHLNAMLMLCWARFLFSLSHFKYTKLRGILYSNKCIHTNSPYKGFIINLWILCEIFFIYLHTYQLYENIAENEKHLHYIYIGKVYRLKQKTFNYIFFDRTKPILSLYNRICGLSFHSQRVSSPLQWKTNWNFLSYYLLVSGKWILDYIYVSYTKTHATTPQPTNPLCVYCMLYVMVRQFSAARKTTICITVNKQVNIDNLIFGININFLWFNLTYTIHTPVHFPKWLLLYLYRLSLYSVVGLLLERPVRIYFNRLAYTQSLCAVFICNLIF